MLFYRHYICSDISMISKSIIGTLTKKLNMFKQVFNTITSLIDNCFVFTGNVLVEKCFISICILHEENTRSCFDYFCILINCYHKISYKLKQFIVIEFKLSHSNIKPLCL